MPKNRDTWLVRTVRLVNGLAGKSSLEIQCGLEIRPDNLQTPKQFFFIELFNPGPFSTSVDDVALCWSEPARSQPVKSIIVGEQKRFPVIVNAGVHWRIHLLPSLIHLTQLTAVSVKLTTGQSFLATIDAALLQQGIKESSESISKWAGGIRLS